METAYHRNLGLKTLWLCWNYQIRGLGFLVLHILMAIVAGLETYPGGLSKPGPVVAVTVIVVLAKLAVFLRLYYLAPDPGRYHASARNYLISIGVFTAMCKITELVLISFLVPKSRIVTNQIFPTAVAPFLSRRFPLSFFVSVRTAPQRSF